MNTLESMEAAIGKYSVAQSPSGMPPSPTGTSSSVGGSRIPLFSHTQSFHNRPRSGSHADSAAFRPADVLNPASKERSELWELMALYLSKDVREIQQYIANHMEFSLGRTRYNLDCFAIYQATAMSVRDRLIESWNDTQQYFTMKRVKRCYYMSLEYLIGRSLQNAIFNLDIVSQYSKALHGFGYRLEELYDEEKDAALGNGGLGRLAACYLDSMATLDLPAWGYGIRYNYGMFSQKIIDGYQAELPDYWLTFGNPWEIERLDVFYPVSFYGRVESYKDETDNYRMHWEGSEVVFAVAYDTPVPGYDSYNTINLRLWSSKPSREFDLQSFNAGDYLRAVEMRENSETISAVLYPNDNTYSGRELRLKQQYFFSSATLQDILRRFKKLRRPLHDLPDYVSIQLNDTHPSISVAELMRLLVDQELMDWNEAWEIVWHVFSFTNHTVLPEALERWPVPMIEHLLPRHMQIIYEINFRFLERVKELYPSDMNKLRHLSIIEEGDIKHVRMANLAIVGSHKVNGVAAIHTEILKESVFRDFYELWPEKFVSITNGVTPRRWLALCNPKYSDVLSKWAETDEWLGNMGLLRSIEDHVDDPEFHREWQEVREYNKARLADMLRRELGIAVDIHSMFDIQIKRIHEYKRQLMNVFSVIHRWDAIKRMSVRERQDVVPRTIMIGGKAAPGYANAKSIIKLINSVSEVINADPVTSNHLKLIFVPNYNVSLAEILIPACDLSQHISTAGTEASGTSNMKFAMNGALILGTMDGANIEIAEAIGEENMFIFGARKDEVALARQRVRSGDVPSDGRLDRVLSLIRSGTFGSPSIFESLLHSIEGANDYYLVSYDFASYLESQDRVDEAWRNREQWIKRSIYSTARSGFFSSDRAISEYAEKIWKVKPCRRPNPYEEPNVPGDVSTADILAAMDAVSLERSSPSGSPTGIGKHGSGSRSPKPLSSFRTFEHEENTLLVNDRERKATAGLVRSGS